MHQLHYGSNLIKALHEQSEKRDKPECGSGERLQRGFMLKVLAKKGTMSVKEIADKVGVKVEMLQNAAKQLETKGWIKMQNEKMELTEDGKQKVQEIKQHKKELAEKVFSALSPEQQKNLLDIMQTLNGKLKDQVGDKNVGCHGGPFFGCGPHDMGPGYKDHMPEG